MNRFNTSIPPDCHLRVHSRISDYEITYGIEKGKYVLDEVHKQHRESAARLILKKGSSVKHHPYYTDVTLDVYVFAPDEFYEIVSKEAMRIAQQMKL